jgi:lysophospholipase L1-like esterase
VTGLIRAMKVAGLAPLVIGQALHVRRTALRLPDAQGPNGVVGEGIDTIRLAVVGDSFAAGIGLTHHRESIAGQLARLLAERHGARVTWQVQAQGGLTAGGISELIDWDLLHDCDLIVLSVGVNDAKDLHSLTRWRRELTVLLDRLLSATDGAPVLLLGIPPMEHSPALPSPLADALGHRAAKLDAVGAGCKGNIQPVVHHEDRLA